MDFESAFKLVYVSVKNVRHTIDVSTEGEEGEWGAMRGPRLDASGGKQSKREGVRGG